MSKMIVTGLMPGMDGEYELAEPPYVQREWHEIKVRTGLRPGDFDEAWEARDFDVFWALAWVTLTRAGHPARGTWDTLGESNLMDVLKFDTEVEEEPDSPPAETPPGSTDSGPGGNDNVPSSGDSTKPASVPAANGPSGTGSPGSGTGATSGLPISVS